MSGQGSNSRLLIGPFTCSPAMGSVAPGNQAIITVECHADSNARTDVSLVQSSLYNPAPFATVFSAGLTRVLD